MAGETAARSVAGRRPVLHGPGYSVYVCAARLALEEKGVAYDLEPVDLRDVPPEHWRRHPFGRLPASSAKP